MGYYVTLIHEQSKAWWLAHCFTEDFNLYSSRTFHGLSFLVRIVCIGVMICGLSGCAKPVWMKPGATNQDFNSDKYNCMQNAMAYAPAAAGSTASWNNGGGNANVGPYGGSATWNGGGGVAQSYDINSRNRQELMSACLQSKDWVLTRSSEQGTNVQSMPPNKQSYVQQMKSEKEQCRQKRIDGIYSSYAEMATCINEVTVRVSTAAKFPRMDLVYTLNSLRTELAGKVDAKEITEDEMDAEMKKKSEELKPPNF